MGKGEELPLPTSLVDSQTTTRNADNCCCCCRKIGRIFRCRCLFVLVVGVSVLLSALFLLPPFSHRGHQGDLDLEYQLKGHNIVASFVVEKPLSLLEDNFLRLEADIFDEIRVPTAKVVIIAARPVAGSNTTRVIFGVDHDEKNSRISSAAKSLIKASFVSLVLRQSSLRLTESLFGDPSSFEVLKFTGGITVTPPQSAFLLQKVQILFNFTLNFSIEQIQDNFDELTSQLKSGLRLASYENLYVSLTNSRGSTVDPPTTVQSSVLLAVGSTPTMARLKELAQTIKGSPKKNLGLNNTEFGKVKQISLSSILQHSLNGSSAGGTLSPAPAPLPPPTQHHHNHHHHHHHHHNHEDHHHDVHVPSPSPETERGRLKHTPAFPSAPALPPKIHNAEPPDCPSGYNRKRSFRKVNKHPHLAPAVSQPVPPPQTTPTPQQQNHRPPPVPQAIPASSPLPNVVFVHAHSPSKSDSDAEPPDTTSSVPSLQPSSCAADVVTRLWAFLMMVLVLALHV